MEKSQHSKWHDDGTSRKTTTSILDDTTGAWDAAEPCRWRARGKCG
ncbi:MAG TPA: hypothetical protein VKM55_30385 [Candidatus Lokiarchaeia archaeon]|nr:hypothetical protein [Candidatus Lokiarchaeia archaeon]